MVFGDRAGRRFADNSRYLFFYLCKYRKDYKCIWISSNYKIINYLRQKKFLCYHPFSLGVIYYCLTAKYHLYNFVENDVNKIITELSDSIHLWHGVLPKKIKEIKVKSSKSNQFLYRKVKKFFLYPNEKLSKNIFDRFPPNKYQLKITNLPRNIIFSSTSNACRMLFPFPSWHLIHLMIFIPLLTLTLSEFAILHIASIYSQLISITLRLRK